MLNVFLELGPMSDFVKSEGDHLLMYLYIYSFDLNL